MKQCIGCVVVGFLSLVLSLQTASAAPVKGKRLNLTGAAFICVNAAQGGCPQATFDPALGFLANAQGTWVANVALPGQTVVAAVTLCGNFNEVGSSITATLDSIPLTASSGFPRRSPWRVFKAPAPPTRRSALRPRRSQIQPLTTRRINTMSLS